MDFSLVSALLAWVSAHPALTGWAIFVISLAESLAIVGLFIPGVAMMFAIGAIVGAGAFPLWECLFWAAAGAVVGDSMSYWLGYYFKDRLRVIWPFSRYPKLLANGERFFERHGGKSVVFGRFVGPVRPVVPVIAGMLAMPPLKFTITNIISALLWAPAYILPGVVFGASVGLASEVAMRLAMLMVALLLIVGAGFWLMHHAYQWLLPRAERLLQQAARWGHRHPYLGRITVAIVDPDEPEFRGLVLLALLLLLTTVGLVMVWLRAVTSLPTPLDDGVWQWLQGIRTPVADHLMIFFTHWGDGVVSLSVAAVVLVWLLVQRAWPAVWHWLAAIAFAAVVPMVLKALFHLPRPSAVYDGISSYGFPSWHVTVSTVMYGFLAVMVARGLPAGWRWIGYALSTLLVALVAFSRLYLGVHWLSDVLGGMLLGLLWLSALGIAYRRHGGGVLPSTQLLLLVALVLVLILPWYHGRTLDRDLERYAVQMTQLEMVEQDWWQTQWRQLPIYRVDVKGHAKEPLNMQWRGPLADLEQRLKGQGWKQPPELTFASSLHWLVKQPAVDSLPLLPMVHNGRHETLLLIKPLAGEQRMLMLRLWRADVRISQDGSTPLWVGYVDYADINRVLPLLAVPHGLGQMGSALVKMLPVFQGTDWRMERRLGDHGDVISVLLARPTSSPGTP